MLSNVAIHDQLTSESATFKSVLSSVTLFIDCWMIGCLGKGGCVHKVLNSNSLPPPLHTCYTLLSLHNVSQYGYQVLKLNLTHITDGEISNDWSPVLSVARCFCWCLISKTRDLITPSLWVLRHPQRRSKSLWAVATKFSEKFDIYPIGGNRSMPAVVSIRINGKELVTFKELILYGVV